MKKRFDWGVPTGETVCLWFDPHASWEARWIVSEAEFEGPPKTQLATFAEDCHSEAEDFAREQAMTHRITCVEVIENGTHVPIGGPRS